jgi:hypothetical protein
LTLKGKISFTNLALIIACGSFMLLIVILSIYNRFAVDDYYHISIENQFGIWGGMLEGYNNWGGRWASYLLWNIVFHFHNNNLMLFLFSFSTLLFFVFSIFSLMKIDSVIEEFKVNKFQLVCFSILFTAFFFQISFSKGEIWFWVVSTCMYITSLSAFLMGLSIIFSKSKNSISLLLLAICLAFAGGASEIYALFYMITLLSGLIAFNIFKKNNLVLKLKKVATWKIYFGLAILIGAFIISFIAPGNSIRQTWLPEPSFSKALLVTFKSLGKILLFKIPLQLPWILLFSMPFLHFGHLHKKENVEEKFIVLLKRFITSSLILLLVLYILMFPACYLLSEIGPDRSLSIVIFVIAFFWVYWSFRFGRQMNLSENIAKGIFYLSASGIIISFAIQSLLQFQITSQYAAALDKRVEYLNELQETGNKKTISVNPLPPSGYLYSAEISADTNYFGNDHFQKGLFLDFKVIIKP